MSDVRFKFDLPEMPKGSFIDMVEKVFKKAMFKAERRSKKDYLSGPRPKKLGVVTGKLRNSIRTKITKQKAQIKGKLGTNVKYGPKHEFGLWPYPARPFLSPAIEDVMPSLKKDIKKKIKKEWDK